MPLWAGQSAAFARRESAGDFVRHRSTISVNSLNPNPEVDDSSSSSLRRLIEDEDDDEHEDEVERRHFAATGQSGCPEREEIPLKGNRQWSAGVIGWAMNNPTIHLLEVYERRMRRFNLTVIFAATVSLALASLLVLVA
jgi:hypothetical protein